MEIERENDRETHPERMRIRQRWRETGKLRDWRERGGVGGERVDRLPLASENSPGI